MPGRQALQNGCMAEGGTVLTPSPRGGSRWLAAPPTPEASLFGPCLSRPSSPLQRGPPGSLRLLATLLSPGPSQAFYQQGRSHQSPQARCPRGCVALAVPFPTPLLRVWDPLPQLLYLRVLQLHRPCPSRLGVACPLRFRKRPPCIPLPPSLLRRGGGRGGRTGPRSSSFRVARPLLAIR